MVMAEARFTGDVVAGHGYAAIVADFDPRREWNSDPVSLDSGRDGYRVRGTLGGAPFRGVMVADASAWWLVLTEEDLGEAGIAIGDSVTVTAEPDA
jgi:hypothetical protein